MNGDGSIELGCFLLEIRSLIVIGNEKELVYERLHSS